MLLRWTALGIVKPAEVTTKQNEIVGKARFATVGHSWFRLFSDQLDGIFSQHIQPAMPNGAWGLEA
jgi:hypothetical protein